MDWSLEDPKVSAPLGSDAGNQLLSSQGCFSQVLQSSSISMMMASKACAYKKWVSLLCYKVDMQVIIKILVVQGKPLSRVREIREDVKQRVLGLIKQEGWELRPESRHWL